MYGCVCADVWSLIPSFVVCRMNQFQSASDEGGKVWGQGYDVCMYVIYIMMML